MRTHICHLAVYTRGARFYLFIYFLITRKNIAKTWPRSGEKGDQNTIKKITFRIAHFLLKKKKKKKEEEEEESKKERKKERKEQKRKEKKKA